MTVRINRTPHSSLFSAVSQNMMQRWCSKLAVRRFISPTPSRPAVSPIAGEIFRPVVFSVNAPVVRPFSSCLAPGGLCRRRALGLGFHPPSQSLLVIQARQYAAKAKDRSRAPTTPVTSKLKKYKLKSYSSFKFRFRNMKDGQIRRWRAGKRHNAHLKSKEAKRRLRHPEVVHPAYAKVLKKLNFCA